LHIDALGKCFEFIGLEELLERVVRPGKRAFCLLTFDDGKRSNATEVAPELLRLGVPAVFYLPTDFVGSSKPLWCDRYLALLAAIGREPSGLERGMVKRLPYEELEARLDLACTRYGIEPDMQNDDIRPMSWEEARGLALSGFTIGAHGLRHAILTNESDVAGRNEIRQSLARVAVEVGSVCTTFAFPNGNYTSALAQYALACGARVVMTTDPTWVRLGAPLWCLPRIQTFRGCSEARMEAKLAAGALGCLLKSPDGTGRCYVIRRW
jgi:peptidoglycan/xylan/chitin deacetylase (PgdA/CDA1 family)